MRQPGTIGNYSVGLWLEAIGTCERLTALNRARQQADISLRDSRELQAASKIWPRCVR